MVDDGCNPIDLRSCGIDFDELLDPADASSSSAVLGPGVLFRMSERVGVSPVIVIPTGRITNPATGEVEIDLNYSATSNSGIFFAEVVINNAAGESVFSNTFFLIIEPSNVGRGVSYIGMPTIAEIRLHLHDNGPADNLLLDDYEFDLAEIASAITRPVDYWNDALPITVTYTTSDFPFRYQWLNGIIANLLILAGMKYMRNDLKYSAGGVNVADMDKAREYLSVGQNMWEEYKQFVKAQKIRQNVESCWGIIGSLYGRC